MKQKKDWKISWVSNFFCITFPSFFMSYSTPDQSSLESPGIPLEALDQEVQEQMLIAAANDQGGVLLELIEDHHSAPFDREIIIKSLLNGGRISARAREALASIMEESRQAMKFRKAHFEEALLAEREQLSDFAGLGSRKY